MLAEAKILVPHRPKSTTRSRELQIDQIGRVIHTCGLPHLPYTVSRHQLVDDSFCGPLQVVGQHPYHIDYIGDLRRSPIDVNSAVGVPAGIAGFHRGKLGLAPGFESG